MVNSQLPLCDPVKETNPSIPEREGTEEPQKHGGSDRAAGVRTEGKHSTAWEDARRDEIHKVPQWGHNLEQPPTSTQTYRTAATHLGLETHRKVLVPA